MKSPHAIFGAHLTQSSTWSGVIQKPRAGGSPNHEREGKQYGQHQTTQERDPPRLDFPCIPKVHIPFVLAKG